MSRKSLFSLFLIFVVVVLISSLYLYYIQEHKKSLEQEIYKHEAHFMQKNVAAMIEEKKKSTTAIALTLASNDALQNLFSNKKELHYKLNKLILDFKKYTNYQNIWIHIVDDKGYTLYRSWTKINDDSFCAKRSDLHSVIEQKKILSDVGVDIFTLNIKSIVPLYDKAHRFIGIIEVISHFNSISKGLQKLGIDSVVAVNEKASSHIKYPCTEMYIQNCYIANFDAPQELQEYLKNNNIKQFYRSSVTIADDYIIASYPLKDYDGRTIAYYIMFKKLSLVSKTGLDYFVFRWSMLAIIVLMALASIVNIVYYFILKKQKAYYKNIIDSSHNIILVNDKKSIVDVNKTFFEYFSKYKTLEEFRAENTCICNFFVNEGGYLGKLGAAYSWLDTVLEHPEVNHKVKIKIDDKIYYFAVNASLISEEKNHYSVIFSDITQEEVYKKELEDLSVKDALTNVYNRRYYEEQMQKEMQNAKRYNYDLSLIMFDIDFFKKVNDTHGHSVGDEVLIHLSELIHSSLREGDSLCRIGGEEFIIILPHTKKEDAAKIAQKLRVMVAEDKKVLPITISLGVTQYILGEMKDYLDARVDKALYEAKENGRNQVVIA